MKKLILILSIFGLFTMASCNKETSTNPTETSPLNTPEEPGDGSDSDDSNNNENDNPLPDYDDGGDWHGVID